MFQSVKTWLHKPYPFPSTTKAKIVTSLAFGKFIFIFLLLFKPFNFQNLEEKTFLFSIAYGLITAVILLVNLFVLPLVFPKLFTTNQWVIYKMLLLIIWLLSIISIANWFFSIKTFGPELIERHDFSFFVLVTVLTGVFPILFYLYLSERLQSKKYKKIADSITGVKKENSKTTHSKNTLKKLITLQGENKEEIFKSTVNNILYITSEKNYASIFYIKDNEIKEALIRTSLSKIEQQLINHKQIVRCHKSYIVNANKVEEIQGNARSFLLKINQLDFLIPVSRNFPREMLFTLVG